MIVVSCLKHYRLSLDEFERHFSSISHSSRFVGSVAGTVAPTRITAVSSTPWTLPEYVRLPSSRSRYILDNVQSQELQHLYSKLYGTPSTNIEVPSFCWKYQSMLMTGCLVAIKVAQMHHPLFLSPGTVDILVRFR